MATAAPAAPASIANDQLRTLLLGTAVRKNQETPVQNYPSSGQLTFTAPKAGLGLFARVHISGTVTPTTNNVTTGPRWPLSLFQNAQLIDPKGVNRVSAMPWHLWRLMVTSTKSWYALQYRSKIASTGSSNAYLQIIRPDQGATLTAGVAATVAGFFDVPLAISPHDLRGAFRLDVANGDTQLILTPAATPTVLTTAAMNSPFTQATGLTGVDTTALRVKVDWYYLDPVAVAISQNQVIVPWPLGDMSYIHELISTTSVGLSPGSEWLWTLPTGREYLRIMHWLNNNTVVSDFSTADFTLRRFLINGNIPTWTETVPEYLAAVFHQYQDLPAEEEFIYSFYQRTWTPDRYGSLQTGLTVASGSTVNGTSTMETLRQTIYQAAVVPVQ